MKERLFGSDILSDEAKHSRYHINKVGNNDVGKALTAGACFFCETDLQCSYTQNDVVLREWQDGNSSTNRDSYISLHYHVRLAQALHFSNSLGEKLRGRVVFFFLLDFTWKTILPTTADFTSHETACSKLWSFLLLFSPLHPLISEHDTHCLNVDRLGFCGRTQSDHRLLDVGANLVRVDHHPGTHVLLYEDLHLLLQAIELGLLLSKQYSIKSTLSLATRCGCVFENFHFCKDTIKIGWVCGADPMQSDCPTLRSLPNFTPS